MAPEVGGRRGIRLVVAGALCMLVGLLVWLGKGHTAGQVDRPGLPPNRLMAPQTGQVGHAAQPGTSPSQQDPTSPGRLIEGRPARHDTSPPLRDMQPAPSTPAPAQRENNEARLPFDPGSTKPVNDPIAQRFFGPLAMPSVITQFAGIGASMSFCNCVPPDPVGDVGPNHYVQMVNKAFQVFNKSGTSLMGPLPINTLFDNFGGVCESTNSGDPIVLYDPLADRWLLSQFVFPSPHGQCIAVSATGDPTGAYHRYYYQFDDPSILYDYPKFGVWPDGYYMTANRYNDVDAYQGPAVMVFERDKMLVGEEAGKLEYNPGNYFVSLLPADLDGATLPPAGAPNYLASTSLSLNQSSIYLWEFHTDWQNTGMTTLTGPATVPVAPFDPNLCNGSGNCIPQPGTTLGIDPINGQLMFRLAYRNFGTHESLVSAQTVDENGADHAGLRWYEVRDPGGSPFVYQQGTYAPDADHRFMPSMAMDRDGNIAIGYSVSSPNVFPSIRYTGRMASDPPGVLGLGEATLYAGGGSQTGSTRWGDYSAMSVDPSDDCTFWYTNEYYSSSSSTGWKTRIGSFKLPGCGQTTPTATGTPPTATPSIVPSATPSQVPASCANYTVQASTGGVIDTAGKALIPNTQCDDCTTYITLPFAVDLYHETYTNAYVSSNGVLQFRSSDFSFGNDCLPASVFDHAIAAYWDDLYTDGEGLGVYWKVSGQAPNRKYSLEWRAGTYSSPDTDPVNFEVRLREGSSNFEIVYSQVYSNGHDATVGVQSSYQGASTAYTLVSCNSSALTPGTVLNFTLQPCPTCTLQFQDVAQDNTFYPFVRCLACKNSLGGYPCGGPGEPCNGSGDPYFRPANNVTRGQLSKIVSESAGFNNSIPASRRTYEDVPPDSPFWLWIERLTVKGVMSGYPCGGDTEPCVVPDSTYFRPQGNATRGQLTKIVANAAAFGDTPPQGQYTFADVLPDSPFYIYTERLLSNRPNVMGGYPCGRTNEPCDGQNRSYFRPNNTLTRGQTAKIVSNTFYPNCQVP